MLHSKSTYFYRWGSRKQNSGSKVNKFRVANLFTTTRFNTCLHQLSYVVPSVCILALLVGSFIVVNPAVNQNQAHAVEVVGPGDAGGTTEDTTPSIALSFPTEGLPEGFDNNAEQVTPANAGEVAYRSNIFDLVVKHTSWYAVLIRAANGYTAELKNNNATLVGVGTDVLPKNFKENTWGYSLTTDLDKGAAELAYSTVPDNQNHTPAYVGADAETEKTERFRLVFAANFGKDSPSGNYVAKTYISTVLNPAQTVSAFGVTTMQEMGKDSTACRNAREHTTGQLIDERDDKIYWITKLKDDNCWMTQNLAFDVPAVLSEETTDIPGKGTEYRPSISRVNSVTSFPSGYTNKTYYNPGGYYYNGPESNPHAQGTNCHNNVGLVDCSQFSRAASNEDVHYSVGNYYSWNAATAGTGGSITTGEAPGSICPKGWKLPTSNSSTDGVSGSFYYLLSKYGVNRELTNTVANKYYAIYDDPLYFVYSGFISNSYFQYAGNYGAYWSSTPDGDGSAGRVKSLIINNSVDVASYSAGGSYNRHHGYSVRCVHIPSED